MPAYRDVSTGRHAGPDRDAQCESDGACTILHASRDKSAGRPRPGEKSMPEQPAAAPLKVLAVDDHPLILEALRQILRQLDAELVLLEAEDLGSALDAARRNPDIRLILLDLSLPHASGFDVLHQLREQFPAMPVVVLSASDDHATVTRALDAGAMGFIPKTSSPQVMLRALEVVFSGAVYLPAEVLGSGTNTVRVGYSTTVAGPMAGPSADEPAPFGLTARQMQVLALMVQGKPNKTISRELNMAEGTVKVHVTAILKALNVHNRTQVLIEVSRLGLPLNPFDKRPPGALPTE